MIFFFYVCLLFAGFLHIIQQEIRSYFQPQIVIFATYIVESVYSLTKPVFLFSPLIICRITETQPITKTLP